MGAEVHDASRNGAHGSENVGMSSKNGGENPPHRKPKVSWATIIDPGLGGPNLACERMSGMDELANIPALLLTFNPLTHHSVRAWYGYTR
jgi:hypothetical protein